MAHDQDAVFVLSLQNAYETARHFGFRHTQQALFEIISREVGDAQTAGAPLTARKAVATETMA